MSIVSKIINAGYKATGAQVETLARSVVHGEQADGTYLKVLVAAVQKALASGRKRLRKGGQLKAVSEVHAKFYPHVQKGVGGASVKERNRRSTFARTAASALRSFVQAGGDIRKLVVADVRKAKLLATGQAVPTGTRIERALRKSGDVVLRTAQRLAADDPKRAKATVTKLITELQGIVDGLDAVKVLNGQRPRARVTPIRRPADEHHVVLPTVNGVAAH